MTQFERLEDAATPLRSGGDSPEARQTRARIVETAERLFRLYGYRKTTVAEIAQELGMSPANVYRFFPSKTAINEEVAASLVGRLLVIAREIAERPEPALARFALLMRTMHLRSRDLFLSDRKLHDMVSVAMDENWGVVSSYVDAFITIIAGILTDGVAAGEFAIDDIEEVAHPAFGAFAAFFHPQLIEQCLREPQDYDLERMMRLVVRGLGGDPAKIPAA